MGNVNSNGSKYDGDLVDGIRHGHGTYTWADGEKYVGEWKAGMPHGQGTMIKANGNKYVGEWKDGKKHGHGTYTWVDGVKYVGEWKEDEMSGGWLFKPDGSKKWYEKTGEEENSAKADNWKKCPYCAEEIQNEAIKCKHCGEWLPENKQPCPSVRQSKGTKPTATQPKQLGLEEIPSFHIEAKSLVMNEKGFSFKGKQYVYNDVIGLYYKHQRLTINFVPSTHVFLRIKISDDNIIKLKTKSGIFNKKTVNALENAQEVLHRLTFENRINFYLTKMQQNGYFDYAFSSSKLGVPSSVRIYADGFVEKKSKKINLRVAKQSGTLLFGTYAESFTGRQSSYSPCEIAISEKNNPTYIGTLRINAEWDTSIIHGIVKLLAEGKPLL